MPDESSIRNLVRRLGAEVAEELADVHRVFIADRQSAGARRTDRRLAKFRVACEGRISHLKRRYGRSRHGSEVTHGTLPSDPPTASPSASGSSPRANLQPGPRHPARPCSSFSAPDSSGGK
jgi:hypothetical protein